MTGATTFSLQGLSAPVYALLARGDYRLLSEITPTTPLEYYVKARAILTRGSRAEFEANEPELSRALTPTIYFELYRTLIKIFHHNELDATKRSLERLCHHFESDRYLSSEISFLTGYVLTKSDQCNRALVHHLKAIDGYRECKLHGPESSALFNLCLSYNHINERELFELYSQQLQSLAQTHPFPSVRMHDLRVRGYQHMEAWEFRKALEVMRELSALCEQDKRYRDLGSLGSAEIFLAFKVGDLGSVEKTLARVLGYPLPEEHLPLVQEWRYLLETTFLSPKEVSLLVQRWMNLTTTSSNKLFLMNIAVEKLLKCGEYLRAKRLCRQACEYSLEKQQAPQLLDFRCLEVDAEIRLGKLEEASQLFEIILHDIPALAGEERRLKCERLKYSLEQSLALRPAPQAPGRYLLHIDLIKHELTWRGETICLNDYPLVESFFQRLAQAGGMVKLDQLFRSIYNEDYHPLRHAHRLHSLVTRARALLKDGEAIVRKEGKIGFAPEIEIHSTPLFLTRRNQPMEKRYGQLMRVFEVAKSPLSISELETRFPCTRRTLQNDLKRLLSSGAISQIGAGRRRSYSIKRGMQ